MQPMQAGSSALDICMPIIDRFSASIRTSFPQVSPEGVLVQCWVPLEYLLSKVACLLPGLREDPNPVFADSESTLAPLEYCSLSVDAVQDHSRPFTEY